MGIPLLSKDHLLRQYLGPLKVLEVNTLIAEFKDEFVGIYHGTTYLGEAFCIILRCVKKDFSIMLRLVKLAFLVGSMNNTQISAILMDTICQHMRVNTSNVLAFMHDSASANLLSYNDKLSMSLCIAMTTHACLIQTIMSGKPLGHWCLMNTCTSTTWQ